MLERYTLPNCFFADLPSQQAKSDYRLFVGGYDPRESGSQPRDVIVVVDGNWLFPLVSEHLRMLSIFTPFDTQPLVIGVGYPTDNDSVIMALRNRDMALTGPTDSVEIFSHFILWQVMNWVQSELRVRVRNSYLAGHSWGGAFALLNLCNPDAPFSGYLASSPVITGTELENRLAGLGDRERPCKLFYSLGTEEHRLFPAVASSEVFLSSVLTARPPGQLNIGREVFQGEDHTSVATQAMAKGVQFLLSQ